MGNTLEQCLNRHEPTEAMREFSIKYLTSRILLIEVKFAESKHGTAVGSLNPEKRVNPFRSQICENGFRRVSTGVPEYDVLFSEIVDFLKKEWKKGNYKEDLTRIVRAYNERHPSTQVDLEEIMK